MDNVPGKDNTELFNYPAGIPIFSLSGVEEKKRKGKRVHNFINGHSNVILK